uniref:Uncharacterized protein n=1 Tax=Oryza brachyantha TaxID=4533 RepID=J3MZQ4_ORYBR
MICGCYITLSRPNSQISVQISNRFSYASLASNKPNIFLSITSSSLCLQPCKYHCQVIMHVYQC